MDTNLPKTDIAPIYIQTMLSQNQIFKIMKLEKIDLQE